MPESVVVSARQRILEASLEIPSEALVRALRELQYLLYQQALAHAGPAPVGDAEAERAWGVRMKAFEYAAVRVLHEHVGGE